MSRDALLGAEARRLAAAAIATIEAQSSAEVVVTLRRQSGDYAAADRLAGALAAGSAGCSAASSRTTRTAADRYCGAVGGRQ